MKNIIKLLYLSVVVLCVACVTLSFVSCKNNSENSKDKTQYTNSTGKGESWGRVKSNAGDILAIVPAINKTVAYWETDFGKKKDTVIMYFIADITEFQDYAQLLINDGWEISGDVATDDGIYKRQSNYYADFEKGERQIHISYSDGGGLTSLEHSYSMSVEVNLKY